MSPMQVRRNVERLHNLLKLLKRVTLLTLKSQPTYETEWTQSEVKSFRNVNRDT